MAKRGTVKPRGYPDRRGMGAESDFISEQFVPSEHYKTQQRAMAQTLIAAGLNPREFDSLSTCEDTAGKQESEPRLIPDGNLQRCSVRGYPLPADVHPSISVAFAEHLMKAHQP
jgi:hypothetical protein